MYVERERLVAIYRDMATDDLVKRITTSSLLPEASDLAIAELESRGYTFDQPDGLVVPAGDNAPTSPRNVRGKLSRKTVVLAFVLAAIAAIATKNFSNWWSRVETKLTLATSGDPAAVADTGAAPHERATDLGGLQIEPPIEDGLFPVKRLSDGSILWRALDEMEWYGPKPNKLEWYGPKPNLLARAWNPTTKKSFALELRRRMRHAAVTDLRSGLLFVGGTETPASPDGPYRMVDTVELVRPDGTYLSSKLGEARARPFLVRLTNQSVLAIGGVTLWDMGTADRHEPSVALLSSEVDLIETFGDELKVTTLPHLPGPAREGIAVVELVNGDVMVLGGRASPQPDCNGCLAETFILDMKTRQWRPGPEMREARSNHSASILPDGSVLVAGGWTPRNGPPNHASLSTELLNPGAPKFKAGSPLVNGVASHQALWAAGFENRYLLLAGGTATSVQAYDLDKKLWRLVGETRDRFQAAIVAPHWDGSKSQLLLTQQTQRPAENVILRIPNTHANNSTPPDDSTQGIALFRSKMSFLPAKSQRPAALFGGVLEGPTPVSSAAVSVIFSDGSVESGTSLPQPMRDPKVVRFGDGGVLIVAPDGRDGSQPNPSLADAYWIREDDLLNGEGDWIPVKNFDAGIATGEADGGTLITLGSDGTVTQNQLTKSADGSLNSDVATLAPIVEQREAVQEQSPIIIRGLPGGKIVIAGGLVMNYDEDLGEATMGLSKTHEIYDPDSGTWTVSVPSVSASPAVAILDDGRVAKMDFNDGRLEISDPAGKSWSKVEGLSPPQVNLDSKTRLFVVDEQILLSGIRAKNSTSIRLVQWFNAKANSWETLWEGKPEETWTDVGRVVVRDLGNGRTIVFPIAGV